MKHIVAVLGDYYHATEDSMAALKLALQSSIATGQCTLKVISIDELVEALESKPDAVIMFAEDRLTPQEDTTVRWMTATIAKAITQYVDAGGGWLAWHSGLASYEPDGPYIKMLRGHFLHHPQEHQVVTYTDCNGTEAFELLDEHYFVQCDEMHTEVYLRSTSVDGQSIAGWRHLYGNGRVSCLAPAHRPEGLRHPELLKRLEHAVLWIIGEVD
ncbi:MAG: ThuA domain-containing protein [Candidatus Cohnella colombiensis]|uniref:ThuA domain-containing protein n=1 Tax=Candidatus Cohnella colombiensis TaxID=3121368 RepID=A0AA95EXN5_9BACL|nr:MAG: ThuA domain-containing protein [Cohnella sp.]